MSVLLVLQQEAFRVDCGDCGHVVYQFPPKQMSGAPRAEDPPEWHAPRKYNRNGSRHTHEKGT